MEGTGPGTRFTFTIPLVEEGQVGVEAETDRMLAQTERILERKPLLLVVDDGSPVLGYAGYEINGLVR